MIRPRTSKRAEFTIRREEQNFEPMWRVIGEKPERWIMQTDFRNDEAVGYLADRLAKLGVENQTVQGRSQARRRRNHRCRRQRSGLRLGANHGCRCRTAGGSRRGEDIRLEDRGDCKTREEKRAEHDERRAAKAAARQELEAERKAGIWTESVDSKYGRKTAEPKATQEEN